MVVRTSRLNACTAGERSEAAGMPWLSRSFAIVAGTDVGGERVSAGCEGTVGRSNDGLRKVHCDKVGFGGRREAAPRARRADRTATRGVWRSSEPIVPVVIGVLIDAGAVEWVILAPRFKRVITRVVAATEWRSGPV
jgi:hypothetical protein